MMTGWKVLTYWCTELHGRWQELVYLEDFLKLKHFRIAKRQVAGLICRLLSENCVDRAGHFRFLRSVSALFSRGFVEVVSQIPGIPTHERLTDGQIYQSGIKNLVQ